MPGGITRLSKVTRPHVEAFRAWRTTTTVGKGEKKRAVSGATVNHDLRCAKAAWSWAIRAGLVRENPFKGVAPIKTPLYEPRALSEFEVRRVLEKARSSELLPMIATAIYAGLREGELIHLEWPDIDFAEGSGCIRVRCDETFTTKSRKPRRVPLAPELRAILEPLARPVGRCFPSSAGTARDPANMRHALNRLMIEKDEATGEKKRVVEPFSRHDLRRTCASLLAAAGVPAWRIRDYLGHASIVTTEAYYVKRGSFDAADLAKLSIGFTPQPAPGEGSQTGPQSNRKAC
jgi:integrase